MNEVAYHAILRRLGVAPASRSFQQAPDHPNLASRLIAFRDQLAAWVVSGRPAVPILGLPGVEMRAGSCISCGEPLSEGQTWRCAPCLAAVQIVLGLATSPDELAG